MSQTPPVVPPPSDIKGTVTTLVLNVIPRLGVAVVPIAILGYMWFVMNAKLDEATKREQANVAVMQDLLKTTASTLSDLKSSIDRNTLEMAEMRRAYIYFPKDGKQ